MPGDRIDYRTGQICATIFNTKRGSEKDRVWQPLDFMTPIDASEEAVQVVDPETEAKNLRSFFGRSD